jgi:hypothetical protein
MAPKASYWKVIRLFEASFTEVQELNVLLTAFGYVDPEYGQKYCPQYYIHLQRGRAKLKQGFGLIWILSNIYPKEQGSPELYSGSRKYILNNLLPIILRKYHWSHEDESGRSL